MTQIEKQDKSFPHRLTYTQIAFAVGIVLSAFLLRVILIYERAQADPYIIPHDGFDQETYLRQALGLLNGTWPVEPYYFHPAPAYLFGGILAFTGRSLIHLYLVYAMLDALTTAWLIAAMWLINRRAWPGFFVGLLFATYPVSILFGTSLLVDPIATLLLALTIFLYLWQRNYPAWPLTCLTAVVAGCLIISRLNLAPLVLLYFLWLCFLPLRPRQRFIRGFIYIFLVAIIVAPFSWHNYQSSGGQFILVATTGPKELYMANNRDSNARVGRSPALDTIDAPYLEALINDIRAVPDHFVGLLIYKFAVFWSDFEPPSNIDFYAVRDIAPVLRANPLSFTWFGLFGLLGLALIIRHDKQIALLLGAYVFWLCFSFLLTFATSRLRYPVIIPLMLLSGFAVEKLVHVLYPRLVWREILRFYIPILTIILLLLGFSFWVLNPSPKFPMARSYAALPEDTIYVNSSFGALRLLGWRPYASSIWPAAQNAYVPIYETYMIELFWQLDQPTDTVYNFALAYVDHSERITGLDLPIGAVSFPDHTTDSWQMGTIYGEIVSLRFDEHVPQGHSGQIRLGVYHWDTAGQLINDRLTNGEETILLQNLAVFDFGQQEDILSESNSQPTVVFGNMIALQNYSLPATAHINETVFLNFSWLAQNEIRENYQLFMHLVDENDNIVSQADTTAVPGLFTENWPVNYPLTADLPLVMPDNPGSYIVYIGFYNQAGRLEIDTEDRYSLGNIIVNN